jgi:translocation protein SEC62
MQLPWKCREEKSFPAQSTPWQDNNQKLARMPEAKDIPKDVLKMINYLQSSKAELKTRNGFINNNRVLFFKGKHAVNAICRKQFMECSTREQGNEWLARLLSLELIMKIDKQGKNLVVNRSTDFNPDSYYIWLYQGKPRFQY